MSALVYRLHDVHGELLYVGVTENLDVRLGQHRKDKLWWSEVAYFEHNAHPDRAAALRAEAATIHKKLPKYNRVHRPGANGDAPAGSLHTRLFPRASRALRETTDRTGLSKLEVVNRSVELYNVISEHTEAGAEVVIHHPDGTSERIPKVF